MYDNKEQYLYFQYNFIQNKSVTIHAVYNSQKTAIKQYLHGLCAI